MKTLLLLVWFLFIIIISGYSQQHSDSTIQWQITTSDGNNFSGFIVDETPIQIKFKTFTYGVIIIPTFTIVSREAIDNSPKKKKFKKDKVPESLAISPDTQWRIVTDDGFDFVGTISSKNDTKIELKTEKFGVVSIQRQNIKSMDIINIDQFVKGEVWFENPQASRYFYTPNGYGLKKGEGYYQNVWVMFNQVSYGFTDYFTMGVGTFPVFLFGAGVVPLWITPKVSFPIIEDKFNLGAGAITGAVFGEGVGFGLVYGVATYGSKDRNVNVGAGYFYADGEWASRPTISVSTMIRTGKKGYIISENFLISTPYETMALLSFGGRTIWPRVSLDYGLIIPINAGIGQFVAIPWLGFVIPIGQNTSEKL